MTGRDTVPIALFAYARPSHTARVLEGIQRSGCDLLYLFSDGPRGEEDAERVEAVRAIVRGVGFTKTVVRERPENLGLARSIVEGVSEVLADHRSIIVLEDDCVPLPPFTNVMRDLLERFAPHERAWSLSGYGPPIHLPADFPYSHYWTPRISSWGWATWRSRWEGMSLDLGEPLREARRRGIDLARLGPDIPSYVDRAKELDIWTPAWLVRSALADGLSLWPVSSLIENIGLDGSGEHRQHDEARHARCRRWEAGTALAPDPAVQDRPDVGAAFNAFFAPGVRARRPVVERVLSRVRPVRRALGRAVAKVRGEYELRRTPLLRELRHLLEAPRRTPGVTTLDGTAIEYVDALSFYHQVKEIHVQRVYDVDASLSRIIDAGANVGTATRRFRRRHPSADIVCLEADPAIATVLRRNLAAFGDDRTTVIAQAAWVHDGYVTFAAHGADEGRVANRGGEVPCVDLARLCASGPVDLLKLDVEGAEHVLIQHLEHTGVLQNVARLICEVHAWGSPGEQPGLLLHSLEAAGFTFVIADARPAPFLGGALSSDIVRVGHARGWLMTVYAWRKGVCPTR